MVKQLSGALLIVFVLLFLGQVRAATPSPYPNATRETNHQSWISYSNTYANPLKQKWLDFYATTLGTFSAPSTATSTLPYFTYVDFVGIGKAVGDSTSPYYGRTDLFNYESAALDWAVSGLTVDGYWWKSGDSRSGDANTNRFALIPILDGARYMRNLSGGETKWQSTWKTPLQTAIQAQKDSYAGNTSWDRQEECAYANQDVYYMVMLALSADLYSNSADLQTAKDWMKCIAKQQQPDGAFYYINNQNDIIIYHLINIKLISRYYELTNDPNALTVLRRDAGYIRNIMAESGGIESWSEPWWKQAWLATSSYDTMGFVIAAGATQDTSVATAMWLGISHVAAAYHGVNTMYAIPFAETAFNVAESGTVSPSEFVKLDRNIRGIRGRYNTWYYGLTGGGGIRNTFAGGMVDDPSASTPITGSFRGALIDVDQSVQPSSGINMGYFLSGNTDANGYTLDANNAGAFGTRYRLSSAVIDPQTPTKSDWQVTQTWYASKRGSVGVVTLEAVGPNAVGTQVVGRIALGPETITSLGSNEYDSGTLHAKLYSTYGTVSTSTVPVYARADEANGVQMVSTIGGGLAAQGTKYTYAVWVGPEAQTPPTSITALSNDNGFTVVWPDGFTAAVAYNYSSAQTLIVPWSASGTRVFKGTSQQSVTPSGGNLSLTAASRDVFLITSSTLDTSASTTITSTPQPTPTPASYGSSSSFGQALGEATAETSHLTLTQINDLPVFVSSEKTKTAQQVFVLGRSPTFVLKGIARAGSTVHLKLLELNIDDTITVNNDSSFTYLSKKELTPGRYTLRVELIDRGKLRKIPDLILSVKDAADVTVTSINTVTTTSRTVQAERPGSDINPTSIGRKPNTAEFSTIKVTVSDEAGNAIKNSEVTFLPQKETATTNESGVVEMKKVLKINTAIAVASEKSAGSTQITFTDTIKQADSLTLSIKLERSKKEENINHLLFISALNTAIIATIVGLIIYLIRLRK